MKKIIRSSRIIAFAILAIILPTAMYAADSTGIRSGISAELKYEGMFRNNPLFSLSVSGGPEPEEYAIHITDSQGNMLYSEHTRAQRISRKFLFNYEELGEETLFLSIRCSKQRRETVYEISRSSHSVAAFSVTALK